MKIAVYAISKNEAAFVERFCESAKEADHIVIVDTGSEDATLDTAARIPGVSTYEIAITPWRFDHARNAALSLVPKDVDVCISLDLDEILLPGWREEIERLWQPATTRMSYRFDWGQGVIFHASKIHHRSGYYWHHPCHEVLYAEKRITEQYCRTDVLLVQHLPDPDKSRGQYLDLLRLSVTEDPNCPRNALYFARELKFNALWDEAVEALQRYLAMPDAVWTPERCYAMRLPGACCHQLGKLDDARQWFFRAIAEAGWSREPWADLASFAYAIEDWLTCYFAAQSGLKIQDRAFLYLDDPAAWGSKLYDLAALSAFHLGLHKEAIELGTRACEIAPDDKRLATNLGFYAERANDV